MINIENESSLHNTLKIYYATRTKGKTEVHADGHIYDIVSEAGEIIEIQTKNLSSLYNKLQDILSKNRKVTLVHPIPIKKHICLFAQDGTLISKRASSKKNHLYDIFSELTKIYPFLLNPNFTLKILEVSIIEERIKTEELVQSKNKKRRFRKNWNKINKRLEEIFCEHTFKTGEDYINLLPALPQEFSSADLKDALSKEKVPARICNNSTLILWVLSKMELITLKKTEKRLRYYSINKEKL